MSEDTTESALNRLTNSIRYVKCRGFRINDITMKSSFMNEIASEFPVPYIHLAAELKFRGYPIYVSDYALGEYEIRCKEAIIVEGFKEIP